MRTFRAHLLAACVGAGGVAALADPVQAGDFDLISPETIHGVIDLRAAAADGEPSFTDGDFGKARYGGAGNEGWTARGQIAEAGLEWRPRFGWNWSATVDVAYQPGQERKIDLIQAYVTYKPAPTTATNFSVRAGLFYPPISLEHDAPLWGVTNTITPSAINSWVGEEVKVAGVEVTVTHEFGDRQLSVTGGVFGADDTAGTLLAYRGWALHDLKSQLGGSFALPPLSPFSSIVQDQDSYSTREIDGRTGHYERIEWRAGNGVDLHIFHYDNRGDRTSVDAEEQWAWDTAFTEGGVRVKFDERTRALFQAMGGRTRDGFPTGRGLFADVSFAAAYALVARDVGADTLTARADAFQIVDHTRRPNDNASEHGWAMTGAWRRPITRNLDLRVEALHVWSDRPSRVLALGTPVQAQTVIQTSLRFTF